MKRLIAMALVVLLASPAAFAQGKGKGKGKPEASSDATVEQTADDAAEEISDAVEDEIRRRTGHPGGGDGPPGLAKKDKVPPGLEKQDKTPEGWTKGEKKGWEDEPEADEERGFFGRTIDRIFGRRGDDDGDEKKKRNEVDDD